MINSPVQLHLSYTNRRPESSTFLTLLNTITTVVAETPGEQLQRLLIAPLLETAELEDDNHVISVDLRHFRISLMGELDGDLSSCGSTQQNRTDIGSESVQSGCLENDSNTPSQSFHISNLALLTLSSLPGSSTGLKAATNCPGKVMDVRSGSMPPENAGSSTWALLWCLQLLLEE